MSSDKVVSGNPENQVLWHQWQFCHIWKKNEIFFFEQWRGKHWERDREEKVTLFSYPWGSCSNQDRFTEAGPQWHAHSALYCFLHTQAPPDSNFMSSTSLKVAKLWPPALPQYTFTASPALLQGQIIHFQEMTHTEVYITSVDTALTPKGIMDLNKR